MLSAGSPTSPTSPTSGSPRVTVFMPAYNREGLVGQAIDSVLAQTLADFELLVIDDGSTDRTPEVVSGYADPRIRLVRNDANLGIPRTRNLGIELARGEYVAMLDTDDLAHPERLEKQVRFLDRHADHALVGSWAWRIDGQGRRSGALRRPLTAERVRARLLFRGCFRTPSVMARRSVISRYRFSTDFPVCSDSDFWVRVALDHRGANLPECLISYRMHEGGITKQRAALVRDRKIAVTAYQLERLGVRFDADDLARHYDLRKPRKFRPDAAYMEWAEQWLLRLSEANRSRRLYPEPQFGHAIGERWFELVRRARRLGARSRGLFSSAPLGRRSSVYLVHRTALRTRYGRGAA